MHDIEPWWGWRDEYVAEKDENRPFMAKIMMNSNSPIKSIIITYTHNGIISDQKPFTLKYCMSIIKTIMHSLS